MKTLLVVFSLALAATALTDVEEWETFKTQYGKLYINHLEENFRYTIFAKNLQKIREHNERFINGESSFEMGINKFSDMTTEEFRQFLGYQQKTKPSLQRSGEVFDSEGILTVPDFINWTAIGAVTDVKDQGFCGSCWSFSTVGTVEGQYFRKTGKLISLSAQNLVDCDKTCSGCGGGWMDKALEYIEHNGIYTDKDYPYHGQDEECQTNKSSTRINIKSYVNVKENQESELQKAVATIGPVSVAIDATDVFQAYQSGIFDDSTCGNVDLNHAVLVVGYGTENGKDYWIVKNSWGESWGERGFIRMSRNAKNQCGIAAKAVYAVV